MSVKSYFSCRVRDSAGNIMKIDEVPPAETLRRGFKIFSGQLTVSFGLPGSNPQRLFTDEHILKQQLKANFGVVIDSLQIQKLRAGGGSVKLTLARVLPVVPNADPQSENNCHVDNLRLAALQTKPGTLIKIASLFRQLAEPEKRTASWKSKSRPTPRAAESPGFVLNSITIGEKDNPGNYPYLRLEFASNPNAAAIDRIRRPQLYAVIKPLISEFIGGAVMNLSVISDESGLSKALIDVTPRHVMDQTALREKLADLRDNPDFRERINRDVIGVLDEPAGRRAPG